jgi:hydrogenase nickel incorporation protein HypB
VTLEKKVQAKGHEIAVELRRMFREKGVFVVNLIGSPGAGKTALLESLAHEMQGKAAVIEGDLATDNDKRRIEAAGMRAYQINTVGACHLDAAMVRDALNEFPLDDVELLFIENVGNLVCPASFEIGEDLKVSVVSTTEGDDKPAKYPKAMKVSSALVITKTDLLPYVECDMDRIKREVREIVPDMPVFETSAKSQEGLKTFADWVREKRTSRATE